MDKGVIACSIVSIYDVWSNLSNPEAKEKE
jgi:hypothetical protein